MAGHWAVYAHLDLLQILYAQPVQLRIQCFSSAPPVTSTAAGPVGNVNSRLGSNPFQPKQASPQVVGAEGSVPGFSA